MSRLLSTCASLALAIAACSGADQRRSGGSPSDDAVAGQILISAAASLTDAFAEIETAFEAAHPAADVVLNLAGSSTLRAQILEGAPADVFASASATDMDRVVSAGAVQDGPRVFARNRLQIAVPVGNPAGIRGLDDFSDEALRLGLCAEHVPCGHFARVALDRAHVTPAPDTEEPDVRALLTKVELGELDAGITYVTDVISTAGAVQGIDLPAEFDVVVPYPIAVLAASHRRSAAEALVAFVLSSEGRSILARHGFVSP